MARVLAVEDLAGAEFPDPDDRELDAPEWLTPDMELVGRAVSRGTTRARLWLDRSIYWAPAPRFRPYVMKGKPFILEHVRSGLPLNAFQRWDEVVVWIDASLSRAAELSDWEVQRGAPEVDPSAPRRGRGGKPTQGR